MFNKFFPNLCVKVNKLWAKLTKNDEVIDVMEKGSVKVNPTLTDTEALITGIEVEGTKYKNVVVEANPTLAGTEADLTGLEVNGTKYAIPTGSLYQHNIHFVQTTPLSMNTYMIDIQFVSKDPTPLTESNVETVLVGILGANSDYFRLVASGYAYAGNAFNAVNAIYSSGSKLYALYNPTDPSGSRNMQGMKLTTFAAFHDTVFDISQYTPAS